MLILVRHAMPDARPDTASENWALTSEGAAAARDLVARLPRGASVVSSNELKAWQTVGGGADVRQDARFNEVVRQSEPWTDDFREQRRAYVSGVDHPGWESRAVVAARFDSGVADLLERADGAPIVIATHGMSMTIWLVSRGCVAPGQAADFWADLRFPDWIEVDLGLRTAHRTIG